MNKQNKTETKQQIESRKHILERDILYILKDWGRQLFILGGTFLMFIVIASPVLISGFILWWMNGFRGF